MPAVTLPSLFPRPDDVLAPTPEDFRGVIIELMPPLPQTVCSILPRLWLRRINLSARPIRSVQCRQSRLLYRRGSRENKRDIWSVGSFHSFSVMAVLYQVFHSIPLNRSQ